MMETPIDLLNPDWIGLAMEVDGPDGNRVGFRLARYEKTARDNDPLWILFSADHPWRIEVPGGIKIRWMSKPDDGGRPAAYYPPQAPAAASVPPLPPPPLAHPHHPPQTWLPPGSTHP
ncbi:hypothetical protein [Streptomyces sp. NPDC049881]|uniref:hypothetical protein n=1 Tax=Streptomyces sp. NPDC049881 TaxID=3155778 RepID=UPI0034325382